AAAGVRGIDCDERDLPAPAGKHCGAGSAGLAVDPFGNVYPCVQWRRPVGNLHEKSLREIWQGSTGLAEVRELTARAKGALESHGPRSSLLNFCPGMAAVHSGGDPLQVYASAVQRKELLEVVLEEEARRPLLPVLPVVY
ncbi:MAG: SPASM domain-containing protein, partial [Thermoanaerobaculia bacterium]